MTDNYMTFKYEKMDDEFSYVPHHTRDSIKLWIDKGIHAGSFVQAVIENDLGSAIGKADSINKEHIPSIVAWFYNYAPSYCWGSKEKADTWAERFKEDEERT